MFLAFSEQASNNRISFFARANIIRLRFPQFIKKGTDDRRMN
jgi:hypothetical protein